MPHDTQSEPAAVDFSKYHRPELIESATGLLSVPGNLLVILRCAVIAVGVSWVTVSYFFLERVGYLLTGAVMLYATVIAVAIGIGWGVGRVIHNASTNVLRIVDVVLELSITAVDDLESHRAAGAPMPEISEVVRAIHRQVVFPAIETTIRGQVGFLAWPVIRFYSLLDRLVIDRVLRRLSTANADTDAGTDMAAEAIPATDQGETDDSVVGQLAEQTLAVASSGGRALAAVRSTVGDWGATIERRVGLLARIAAIMVATLGTVPLALLWYWSG